MEERRRLTRRHFLIGCGSFLGSALVAACAKPQVVEKVVTRVIEKPVKETVIVEKAVKETVVVEKVVKETVIVKSVREVQVTPEPTPSAYHESPILAERVKAGELPPVDARLPEDPLVLRPNPAVGEAIGKYGGTLNVLEDTPSVHAHSDEGDAWGGEGAGTWDLVEKRYAPNVATWWELSEDYRTLSIRLRKGMRWSDGAPFTTDDVRFWWEDITLNEELTPKVPSMYAPKDQVATLVIEDEVSFRFQYVDPNPGAVDRLSQLAPWAPKHYLKKWHIKYNPQANDLAKEEGYGEWWEAFDAHQDRAIQTVSGLPMLAVYIQDWVDETGTKHFVRNPYYWKVDTEGNQLPYIDYYQRNLVGSKEIVVAKAVTGEYNFGGAWASLENYSLLKENEEKGGYIVRLYTPPGGAFGSSISWCFNYCSKDPVLREIFNDLRFRKAISYACNRDEYNQVYNLGLAKPRQGVVPPAWSFYEEGMDQYYIEYDPELANQLLDEMGLKWDEAHEWRLRPDGERLSLFTLHPGGVMRQGIELLAAWWKEIGVEFIIKPAGQELFRKQLLAEELDVGTWGAGGPDEVGSHGIRPIRLIPPWHWVDCCALGGLSWWYWWDSEGEKGVEPPEEVKHLLEVWEEWMEEPLGTERYMELGEEINRINAENLWWFILTGLAPGTGSNPVATTAGKEVRNMRTTESDSGGWIYELLWLEE